MKIAKIIIEIISLLLALAGVILAYGDTVKDIPNLPQGLVHSWPFVFGIATFVNRIGTITIASLQKWVGGAPVAKLAVAILIPILFLSGCSTTTTTAPDGTKVTISKSDPKTISIIAGAVGAAAASAAAYELESQAAKQNLR